MTCKLALFFAAQAVGAPAFASETVVDTKLHHLRAGDVREWTEFAEQAEGDATELCRRLTDYDEAVAVQASSVWAAGGESLFDDDLADALSAAPAHVGRGFAAYTAAWKESQAARARQPQ